MTVIVNAILDPIMINWWGFNGVAIATVISEFVCLAYAFAYHYKKKWFSFDFKAMTWEDVKTMGRLCVPTSIQSIMPALSSAVMITFVNPFGLTALAGYGVVRNLELIMFMPTNAMSMAVTSIVGQCKGAGRIDRAGDYCKKAMLTGGVLIGLVSALVICTSPMLSGCFGQGAEVGVIVAEFFHIVSIGYVLYMLTSCIQGYITGIGRPERAMLLLIAYYIIFRVLPALMLKHIFGLSGIWFAFLVSHILACVLAFVLLQISDKIFLKPVKNT